MRVKQTRKVLDNLDSAGEFITADKPRAAAGEKPAWFRQWVDEIYIS